MFLYSQTQVTFGNQKFVEPITVFSRKTTMSSVCSYTEKNDEQLGDRLEKLLIFRQSVDSYALR